MSTTPVPERLTPYAGLVDDAAVFPPGNTPVPEAVRGHADHRRAWYAALVGGFVCADTRLTELQAALDDVGHDVPRPLTLTLTVSGGAGAIEPALTWVGRDERLTLGALEVALRDEDDLARNATRMSTVLGNALPPEVDAYVEMPRLHGADISAGWAAALDELAAAGLRLKYRTGGPEHQSFPSSAELAAVIGAALDREVEFKLTAGLHHAVRHTAGDTGFEHHGFLNVLLATRASLDGAAEADAAALLDERDPAVVAGQVADLGLAAVSSTRRWFTSFGSCSVLEPVDDLVELDLIGEGSSR